MTTISHVANCKPLIKHGFTWASIYWPIISHSVVAALGGLLGWTYRGRRLNVLAPAPVPAPVPTPDHNPVPTPITSNVKEAPDAVV